MVIDIARSVKLTLGILKDDTELSPRKIKRLRDIANSYGMRFSIDLGERLYFAAGSDKNIKLTTKDDLALFKAYLRAEKETDHGE